MNCTLYCVTNRTYFAWSVVDRKETENRIKYYHFLEILNSIRERTVMFRPLKMMTETDFN